jgi:hypothetical protein
MFYYPYVRLQGYYPITDRRYEYLLRPIDYNMPYL